MGIATPPAARILPPICLRLQCGNEADEARKARKTKGESKSKTCAQALIVLPEGKGWELGAGHAYLLLPAAFLWPISRRLMPAIKINDAKDAEACSPAPPRLYPIPQPTNRFARFTRFEWQLLRVGKMRV